MIGHSAQVARENSIRKPQSDTLKVVCKEKAEDESSIEKQPDNRIG